MKNLRITFVFSIVLFAVFSCNKEQKTLNNLEGKWKTVSVLDEYGDEIYFPLISKVNLDFESCDKKASSCQGKWIISEYNYTYNPDGTVATTSEFITTNHISYFLSNELDKISFTFISWEDSDGITGEYSSNNTQVYTIMEPMDEKNMTIKYPGTYSWTAYFEKE